MRERRVPKAIGKESLAERAARFKRIRESLVGNLNANVRKDGAEKPASTKDVNKNGEKND